jgi:thiamine transporter
MGNEFTFILEEYLKKLIQPVPLASISALALLAVIFFIISRKTTFDTKMLAYGSIAIAASFILSYIKIIQFPNGGSITIASMLPLFIFAYIAGARWGIIAGLCYGLLQYIQEPFFVHWAQFLLDYPLAFAMLGLAGIFRKNIYLGALTGGISRLICHFISGVVFFGSYAGEQNVFVYSLVYNISYILPDMAICMLILAIPGVRSAIERIAAAGRLSRSS